jgi:hypothetical protein
MKIRISEMFEHATANTDTIELKDDSGIDKEKVKQMVMHKINSQPGGTNKRPTQIKKTSRRVALFAAAIIAMLLSALTVNAATGGKLFGAILLNKENRHIAKEPNYASMQAVSPRTEIAQLNGPILNSNIINKNQLQTVRASSVTNIAVTENDDGKYAIPELLLKNNGGLVIFTKKGDSGWHLNKGEQLTIRYTLDLKTNKDSDPAGEWMEIGYIKNGELFTSFAKKAKEFSYTITADEMGEFYFYAVNYSAGKIIIASGAVN